MAKIKPFFSIIIPALNEAKYLPKLLGDLSAQTYRDFEVIVVDGNSVDKTVTKAEAFTTQLPKLTTVNSPRRHVCTQRNLGANHAKADTLIFMDADNRLPPYFIQGVKYRLESDPADVATCYLQSDRSSPLDNSIATAINIATDLLKNSEQAQLMEALVISTKNAFRQIGGFDENTDLAEGRKFMKQSHLHHLTFRVFRDPSYIYSFRRIRKYGTLNLAGRLAQHEIAQLLNIPLPKVKTNALYPMLGGTLFNQPASAKNKFLRNIQKLLKDL